jgi:hypothetical protein
MAIGTWTIMPKHQEDPRGDPPDAMKKRSVKECPEAESQRFGIRYVGTMVDAEYVTCSCTVYRAPYRALKLLVRARG